MDENISLFPLYQPPQPPIFLNHFPLNFDLRIYCTNNNKNRMFVAKPFKKIISNLDLFSSIQLLRFDGESETKTFTGETISFALIIYLISTFSTMVIDTFNKLIITSSLDSTQPQQPEPIYLLTTDNASHFMLGVEVWHFDFNTGPRYFDVVMRNSFMVDGQLTNDSVTYNLQPCTINHWQSIPNISSIFDKVNMNRWLCLPLDVTPVLKGKYYSDLQTTFDIELNKCKNETDPSRLCAPQEQIDTFLLENGPLYFAPFFVNPQINPQNKDYLNLYLEDRYYTMFGYDSGMEMYIFNAGYKITTDQSILPFSSSHIQNGSVVVSVSNNGYNLGNSTYTYSYISFMRDPTTIVINRSYQKIIDAFSYVGGLLGSFLLVLIFVNFYNECSYEMRFASMYKSEKDSPTTAKKFNIGYYFLQSLYSLFQTIKVNCQKWRTVKYFHQTREEIVRQLDVRYLFKKLHILQNAMMLLLTKPQLKGLMLQHEMTVAEAKKMRKTYGLKHKIKKLYRQKLKDKTDEPKNKNQLIFKTTSDLIQENKKQFQAKIANEYAENTQKPQKTNIDQFSSSDSGQSSESSQEQNFQTFSQEMVKDLNRLKQQSQQNNTMSTTIFKNIDPFVKKIYQHYTSQLRQFNQKSKFQNLGNFSTKQFIEITEKRVAPKLDETENHITGKKHEQSHCFTFIQD